MINYETLLSSYDNKLTLMKWLQKVEAALLNASLSSVSISQPTSDTAILTFVFADGSTLASPTLSLPAGPQGPQGVQGPQGPQGVKGPKGDTGAQGPKGDDGTSVRILADADACTQLGDGYIDANGDLQVLTNLSPKTFTNAGHIQGPQGPQGEQGIQGIQGPQGIQGEQGIQGPAGQNGTNGTNGTDGVSITNVSVNASNHLIVTLSSGSTIDAGEIQVSGGMSNPMTTQGDIIVGGASGTPTRLAKGTAGQVLAMNSDATGLEWTNAGGGGGASIGGGFTFSQTGSGALNDVSILGNDGTNYGWHRYTMGDMKVQEIVNNTSMLVLKDDGYGCVTYYGDITSITPNVLYGYDGVAITPGNINSYANKLLYLIGNCEIVVVD